MRKIFFYFALFFLLSIYAESQKFIFNNPYKDIKWDRVKRYKANLHTHTKESDGKEEYGKVISLYKEKGYSILSITDHNKILYPSEKEIFLIKGVEIGKKQHHILGYFSFKIPEIIENVDEETIIKSICENGTLCVFAHPGRYEKKIEWYVNFFLKYENLIGIEVLNPYVQVKMGKIYGDTDIWDGILKRTMPERNVFGFGNDDFHDITQFSINWNEFLIERIDEGEIKKAMGKGNFYTVSAIRGYDIPFLKKLIFDEKRGYIKIICENYKEIRWISDGKIVAKGEKIYYKRNKDIKNYLRAEIHGKEGFIYLNPIGVKNEQKDMP